MKRYFLAAAMAFVCGFQLFSQVEPSVSIKLNDEERFRFEDQRLEFVNPGHHVLIGDSAGYHLDNSSGYNVFLGYQAGFKTTTGWDNVFIGDSAGYNNLGGSWNTAVGSWAGYANTSGSENSFFGLVSGGFNTTGSKNSYFGFQSGVFNESGSLNSYFGYLAGYKNYGSKNVLLGAFAGIFNTGDSNVFIGYEAGKNETGSQKLVIANSETLEPLIYGEFDNKMLRLNSDRVELRNPLENTILGDSAGMSTIGERNVFIGFKAGYKNVEGHDNTFIGDSTGCENTIGSGNVFLGNFAGLYNTGGMNVMVGIGAGMKSTFGGGNVFLGPTAGYSNSGNENVFIGYSAGANNTTGSSNTFIGRRSGWSNETGNGSVFIGFRAGHQETGSNKLYIANDGTAEPLIFGDFAEKNLKFHADSVQATGVVHASGEVRTDEHFNANGFSGITDTINTVTSYDFIEDKLKYRTTVYNGGIATFMSIESEWVDEVGEYLVPCGEIGLVGEFSNWTDDVFMTRNSYNPDLWTLSITFTDEDDLSNPPDGKIEVKFREDASWNVNWGSTEFPSGTGTQGGPNIPVALSAGDDETLYYISFNCRTGAYSFDDLTGYCGSTVTDTRDNKVYGTVLIGNQCWMTQDLNVGNRIDGGEDQSLTAGIQKYCYDNLEDNCTQWGGLYQWYELMQNSTTPGIQGICPAGFHVPTDEECKILEGIVDSQYGPDAREWNKIGFRGFDAGTNLKATSGWSDSGNGTDSFGFNAKPGGYYSMQANGFYNSGSIHQIQTSSMDMPSIMAWVRNTWGPSPQIYRNTNSTQDGNSLRCLKNQ